MEQVNNDNQPVMDDSAEYSKLKILSYTSTWYMDSIFIGFFGAVVFYFYEVEVGLPS